MATTQLVLNGTTQIADNSIPPIKLTSDFKLPTSQLTDGSLFAKTSGFVMTGQIDMGGNPIINSVAPTSALSLVTRAYVDALVGGFTLHGANAVASTNVATLSGYQTIDGVFGSSNFVALLIGQDDPTQNGPWLQQIDAWTRPSWWATGSTLGEGNYFVVDGDGQSYPNTKWFVNSLGSITVGYSAVSFRQDLSGTNYVDGNGLVLNGVVFSINPGNGIALVGKAVTVKADPAYLGRVTANGVGLAPGISSGQFLQTINGMPIWNTLGGDATFTSAGTIVVTSTNGSSFAPSATTDTTQANNISTGVLPAGRINGSYQQLTGLGTITVGTWNATPISTNYGGTGLTSLPIGSILVGNGGNTASLISGSNAQVLIGLTGGLPAFQSITGDVSLTSGGYMTVDNTPGTGFIRYTDIIRDETPQGTIDGTNVNFTLAYLPQVNSLELTFNGVEAEEGSDYTLSGVNITTLYPLNPGNKIRADYIK